MNFINRRNLIKKLSLVGSSYILTNCTLFDISPDCENLSTSGKTIIDKCKITPAGCNSGLPRYNFEILERTTTSLLQADKPWESFGIGYSTVMYNGQKWQMWYESLGTDINDFLSYLCYAESADGVRWVKPKVGLNLYNNSYNNNILLSGKSECNGIHGPTIFIDPDAPTNEKYKMTYSKQHNTDLSWIYGAVSKDGIFWSKERCLLKRNSDTQTVCIKDGNSYKLYSRLNRPLADGTFRRTIGYSESSTFAANSFCDPVEIFGPDGLDDEKMDFYNSALTKINSRLYIMLPSAFYYSEDTVIPHLAFSEDGINFCRFNRTPFIQLGKEFDTMSIYVSPGAVPGPKADTYWLYYTGVDIGHNQRNFPNAYSGGIGRFLLKIISN
ncbi:hypothetical protein Q0590_02715 [Rhodocytophaga aerolata]|uniref:DUF4185 domain-containing protein n=1 Tax=Rhodocytophaga aerolata TaxID=455078 RepID=A0ABT8QZ75_9BACT|nr:hypothetical protein [Rhodocytophaga aerolata]MDO1445142.1 hypothetical protein [Rhodocytophaga aerolata]